MTQPELDKLWNDAKERINLVNLPQQSARKEALKVGVAWPPTESTEAVSEVVAFDALTAANETVLQAQAALETAVVSFQNTVDEKIALINRNTAYWKAGLEVKRLEVEAAKPKPPIIDKPPVKVLKKLVGSSLKPDPDFSIKNFSGELEKTITRIGVAVEQTAKEKVNFNDIHSGNLGRVNYALATAWRGQVGRSVRFWITELSLIGRAFGSSWHLDESIRCFDELMKSIVEVTATIGGKKHTYWEFNYNYDVVKNSAVFKSDPNDKEWGLALGALDEIIHNMWESGRDDLKARIKRGEEILAAADYYWYHRSGRNWLWSKGPRDRVIHPYTAGIITFDNRAQRTNDKDARADFIKLRDDSLKKLEAEMMYYDNGKFGECLTWAYNVWEATEPRQRNDDRRDGYQPFVYVMHNQLLFLQLGLKGLGMFASERFQKALANTMYAGMASPPQKFVCKDGTKMESYTWVDHCPVSERVVDGTKTSKNEKAFENEYQKRILVTSASKDGTYFEPKKQVDAAGAGLGLMMGSPEFAALGKDEFVGSTSGTNISFLVGYALRLGLQEDRFVW